MKTVCVILVLLMAAGVAKAEVVYTNTFESKQIAGWTTVSGAGEWTNPVQISRTPNGARHFLGEFGNQSATLTLGRLPEHDTLTVSFDLLILRSWDGNADPDIWELRADGALLVSTTFSNVVFPQAYPAPYSVARMDAHTGAAAVNSMGYTWSEPDVFDGPMDSYYHLEYSFPHSGPTVNLEFKALLNDVRPFLANESWGLDNVIVRTGSPEAPSPGTTTETDIPQYDLSDVVVTMRRTACFGHCPVYTVTIYGSGRVEFRGENYVARKGVFLDSIPQEDVNRLVHALHSKGFFSMQDRYDNRHITDLPATITAFESGTTKKSVYDYHGAPEQLREIERLIDDIARTEQWIKGREK